MIEDVVGKATLRKCRPAGMNELPQFVFPGRSEKAQCTTGILP